MGERPVLLTVGAAADSLPSWLVFQVVEQCNLRCPMCYEWGTDGAYHGRKPAELDLDIVLATLADCRAARPHVELFGGEPLLYSGLWDVLDAAAAGGSTMAFPTNGTHLQAHADRLVRGQPLRLWVSLDGPPEINDAQRGQGVFERAMAGLAAVDAAKRRAGLTVPELGIAYVVTPDTAPHIERFFLSEIDLAMLSCVSVELQSYATADQHLAYAELAANHFGVTSTPHAKAYVEDPAVFADVDVEQLARQLTSVRDTCTARGIEFFSQPRSLTVEDLSRYLSADWSAMSDRRMRCAVPWVAAEISARGDVSACHSFYDIALGNVYEQPLVDIWRGQPLQKLRALLRRELLPICTACCRYYSGAAPGR